MIRICNVLGLRLQVICIYLSNYFHMYEFILKSDSASPPSIAAYRKVIYLRFSNGHHPTDMRSEKLARGNVG